MSPWSSLASHSTLIREPRVLLRNSASENKVVSSRGTQLTSAFYRHVNTCRHTHINTHTLTDIQLSFSKCFHKKKSLDEPVLKTLSQDSNSRKRGRGGCTA